jgi:hypothetical protein
LGTRQKLIIIKMDLVGLASLQTEHRTKAQPITTTNSLFHHSALLHQDHKTHLVRVIMASVLSIKMRETFHLGIKFLEIPLSHGILTLNSSRAPMVATHNNQTMSSTLNKHLKTWVIKIKPLLIR